MKKATLSERLAFIKSDVSILFAQLPKHILNTPIEGYENLRTMLSNIEIASDENDDEPSRWLKDMEDTGKPNSWFELAVGNEGNRRGLAKFSSYAEALAFLYDYKLSNPHANLSIDEWAEDEHGNYIKLN
jgi:hypothetical protein